MQGVCINYTDYREPVEGLLECLMRIALDVDSLSLQHETYLAQ